MKTVIAPQLFTVAGILSEQECREFIDRGEGLGFEAATVATTGGAKMLSTVRNNDRAEIESTELADWFWQRVKNHVPAEIDGDEAIGLNERFKFYRYDPSQRFNAHRDGVVECSPTERSKLTFLIYLNEGAEGGQTNFYSEQRENGLRKLVASIDPKMGMGLFFAHEWWHEGARVTSGRKYVLRTDVMFRSTKSSSR